MDGVLFVIDELGRSLAALKAENARLRDEIARLRAAQPEATPDQVPTDSSGGAAEEGVGG